MKHQSAEQLREAATIVENVTMAVPLTRKERIERWADLFDRHAGPLQALYRIEYLPAAERRAYRAAGSPLALAYSDEKLRADGLKGETLGDAMDFFDMTDEDAHHLLCDCHYMGSLTGRGLASRLRRYASGNGVFAWARGLFA